MCCSPFQNFLPQIWSSGKLWTVQFSENRSFSCSIFLYKYYWKKKLSFEKIKLRVKIIKKLPKNIETVLFGQLPPTNNSIWLLTSSPDDRVDARAHQSLTTLLSLGSRAWILNRYDLFQHWNLEKLKIYNKTFIRPPLLYFSSELASNPLYINSSSPAATAPIRAAAQVLCLATTKVTIEIP